MPILFQPPDFEFLKADLVLTFAWKNAVGGLHIVAGSYCASSSVYGTDSLYSRHAKHASQVNQVTPADMQAVVIGRKHHAS